MNKNKFNIEEEIRKTMDSIDAIKRVEGNPFLHTRLQERLHSRKNNVTTKGWFSPVWQFALIAFLLIANGLVLLQSDYFNTSSSDVTIDEFATEYELTPNENDEELAFYNIND